MLLSGMSTSAVTPPAAAALRGGIKALPFGAAGLVDVDVGVDDAGHDDGVVGVDELRAGGHGVERGDGDDAAGLDVDGGGPDAGGGDDALAADHEFGGHGVTSPW
jgi:hypothetical protein